MKLKSHFKGFTLVELIIVITILAILATIAFVSFQGYTKNARDGSRLADFNSIQQGLELYTIKSGSYPMPEDYITIYSSGSPIGYQGYFGGEATRVTNMNKTPIDPLDNINYTYNVNSDLNAYQITGFLENSSNVAFENNLVSKTYASSIDYSTRIVKSFGKELGVLLINTGSDINRPLQEKYDVNTFTGIDVKLFTGTLSSGINVGDVKAIFNNNTVDNIIGTGNALVRLENIYKQKMQIVMSSCPSGWSEKGVMIADLSASAGATGPTMCIGGQCKVCEASIQTYIPNGSQIAMSSCPSGWIEKGLMIADLMETAGATGPTMCIGGQCKVCEASTQTYIPKGSQIAMSSCPSGWIEKEIVIADLSDAGATGPTMCIGGQCKVCEKK